MNRAIASTRLDFLARRVQKRLMPDASEYAAAARFRAELRRFLRRSEDCARLHGITPRQHLLLLQIAGAPGESTTVSELVESLALAQSAVTELVQRAEAAGLVHRRASPADGRVVDLTLTRDGREKLKAVHTALGPERRQLRAVLDELGN
jgi:DNA-binding MarR family transcriptional regulator